MTVEDILEWVHLKAEAKREGRDNRCGRKPPRRRRLSIWPRTLSASSKLITSGRVSRNFGMSRSSDSLTSISHSSNREEPRLKKRRRKRKARVTSWLMRGLLGETKS